MVRPVRTALAFIPPGLGAVAYFRFLQPFAHLPGWRLRTLDDLAAVRDGDGWRLDPALLDGVDVLVFAQVVLPAGFAEGLDPLELIEKLCDDAGCRGIPVVYAPDDAVWEITPDNPSFDQVRPFLPLVDLVRRRADAFLVTTATLGAQLDDGNRDIFVVPNAIEPDRWPLRPRTSGEWRVGWSGGASHVDDLLAVVPALQDLCRRQPVQVVVQGLVAEPFDEAERNLRQDLDAYTPAARVAAEKILELIAALRACRARHVPFKAFDAYRSGLPRLDLDIGLCPLRDTPFNRSKSAVKFYEYACCGFLTVASDIPPYAGEVSLTVPDDPRAWADALEFHLRRADVRAARLHEQRAFVLAERNIATVSATWAAVLDQLRP